MNGILAHEALPVLCPVQEPTQAATDSSIQALVVSKETVKGGDAINSYRTQHGYKALDLIVVELVGTEAATPSGKLSSTELRAMEAEQKSKRGHRMQAGQ